MAFGVTPQGFNKKTISDTVISLQDRWKTEFGEDQDFSNDSPNSILIGLIALELDPLWQAAQDTYNAMNPSLSSDISLDNNVSLIGLQRNGESPTKVNISLKGINGTVIPINTQLSQSTTGNIFVNKIQGLISSTITNSIDLQINSLQGSSPYSLIINGIVYTYNSDSDPTFDEIVDGLSALLVTADIGITLTNNSNGAFNLKSDDLNDTNNINATSLITIVEVESILEFESLVNGSISAPATSIDTINSSISGLNSVINYFDGIAGSDIESDTNLRIRRDQSVSVTGNATEEAIKAKLLNDVEGISFAKVYENDTLNIVNGIDPKSFEAIIQGGSDNDIANTLFVLKDAGISLSGNTSINITDSEGVIQTIKFSRPLIKFAWVKVTIDEYNTEESLPTNFEQAIKDNIVEYSDSNLNIGDDIILQKLFTPIYKVKGIKRVTIETAITNSIGDTPIYGTLDIAINIRELADFDTTRISIVA
jgi:uncharacterized phage protein gp47/JayE